MTAMTVKQSSVSRYDSSCLNKVKYLSILQGFTYVLSNAGNFLGHFWAIAVTRFTKYRYFAWQKRADDRQWNVFVTHILLRRFFSSQVYLLCTYYYEKIQQKHNHAMKTYKIVLYIFKKMIKSSFMLQISFRRSRIPTC